jgi:UMF1 family MFS transporter
MAHVLMFPFIFSFFLLLFVEIAHTDGGRGKVAGLRQAFSLLAQLTFVLIIGVVVGLVIGADAFNTAIVGNVFCAIWVGVFIPMAYNSLNDRSHSQTRTANMVTHAFSQLFHTFKEAKKYPQTFKFLLMHAFASSGVGSIVTQLATYAVVQLKLPGLQISVLVVLILVCAIPSALLYSYSLAYRFSNKSLQIGTIVWFILFVLYFGLVVNGPSSFGVALPGAMMAGVGFGLWYSLNPAHYMKMIPSDRKAEFVGLYSFCAYLPRFLPPLVYNGFVEGLNDHQMAFLSLILWFVLGLIFAVFIDYEQGALDANASAKDEQGAAGGIGGAVVTPAGDAAAEVVVDTVAM